MAIDAGIYDRLNTNFGQQLGAIFDPNANMERQNRLASLAGHNELQNMQLMQARNEMARAPITQQRQDTEYAQKVAEHQTLLADAQRKRDALAELNHPATTQDRRAQLYGYLFPEEAAKQAFKPPTQHVVGNNLVENGKSVFSAPEKPKDWQDPEYLKYEQDKARFTAGLKPAADPVARDRLNWEMGKGAAGSDGKAPAGYRWLQNGDMEAVKGGPADIKEQAKSSAQEMGRENVSQTIASLRDAYGQLKEGGGITDPNASGVSNFTAGMQSSGMGQAAGRMFGTQNQSKRNEILMTRPALLQHIMKATGMSAKQMDSNAELKLWLSTATDPTLDISANMNALDRIEKTYGIGGAQPTAPTQPKANPHSGKTDAQIRAELGL